MLKHILRNLSKVSVRILHPHPEGGKTVTQDKIDSFLENSLNLQLATVDQKGEPNIQPLWFYHDKENQKLYFSTSKNSKKIQNLQQNKVTYFSIDEDNPPYRCVKGKSDACVSENISENTLLMEKICQKYLGGLDNSYAKNLVNNVKNGNSVVVEIKPHFYSTWDFS